MTKKDYNPTSVYDRKLVRNIIRERVIDKNGYHNVSGMVHETFKEIREKKENK